MGKKPGVFPGLLYFGGGEKPSRSAKRACCRAGGLGRFFEAKNIALDSILSRKAFALLTSKKKPGIFPGFCLEVERIELSSLASKTAMTTCLSPYVKPALLEGTPLGAVWTVSISNSSLNRPKGEGSYLDV